jgi:hypothetical protein
VKNLPPGVTPADLERVLEAVPGAEKGGWILREGEVRLAQAGAPSPPRPAAPPATSSPAPVEPLPAVTVEPPRLKTVGPLTREGDYLSGIGRTATLTQALFESLAVGQAADQVFEVSSPDGFALARLTSRSDADMTKFDSEKADLIARLAETRSMQVLLAWVESACKAASQSGAVKVDPAVLAYEADRPIPFQPCGNLNVMSVMQQIDTRHRR